EFSLGKMRHTIAEDQLLPGWAGQTNWPIVRFAEVILWYSEILFKTGNEPKAREILREVRLRAAGGDQSICDQLTTEYYRANFMEEIMQERSRELMGEGQRKIDLIR